MTHQALPLSLPTRSLNSGVKLDQKSIPELGFFIFLVFLGHHGSRLRVFRVFRVFRVRLSQHSLYVL